MLSGVIRIETAAIVGFDDLQPLLVECVQRTIVAIEVVENADFHSSSRQGLAWLGIISESARANKIGGGAGGCRIDACRPPSRKQPAHLATLSTTTTRPAAGARRR